MKKILIISFVLVISFVFCGMALADLNDGLVAYYPFNGNANDESGNGNHGYVEGATLIEDRFGNPDSSYRFDGENDYIEIPDNESIRITPQLTLSAWIFLDEVGLDTYTIIEKGNTSDDWEYHFNVMPGNKIRFFVSPHPSGGYYILTITTATLETKKWYNVIAVFEDNVAASIYINGKLSSSSSIFNSDPPYSPTSASLSLGARTGWAYHPDPIYVVNGVLDDIRIYNRALSEEEIWALFNDPCTLSVNLSYVDDTLTMDFRVGTLERQTTWNVLMSIMNFTFPLWSVPLPAINPPVDVSLPIPSVPSLGTIGVLTTLTTSENGIICSDWATVDTGPLSTREAVPTAKELKDLFKNSQ